MRSLCVQCICVSYGIESKSHLKGCSTVGKKRRTKSRMHWGNSIYFNMKFNIRYSRNVLFSAATVPKWYCWLVTCCVLCDVPVSFRYTHAHSFFLVFSSFLFFPFFFVTPKSVLNVQFFYINFLFAPEWYLQLPLVAFLLRSIDKFARHSTTTIVRYPFHLVEIYTHNPIPMDCQVSRHLRLDTSWALWSLWFSQRLQLWASALSSIHEIKEEKEKTSIFWSSKKVTTNEFNKTHVNGKKCACIGTWAYKIQLIKHFDFQFEHCSVICESYLLEKNVNKPTNKRIKMKEEHGKDDDDKRKNNGYFIASDFVHFYGFFWPTEWI